MLTKMMAAVVMTGALWVTGDAASKNLGCCFPSSWCCGSAEECCTGLTSTKTDTDCCSPGTVSSEPVSDCCVGDAQPAPTTTSVKSGCCSTK